MATQIVSVISARTNKTLHQTVVKFPRIADALADTWEVVNSILVSPVDCGGSFGDERNIALHMSEYSILFSVTR